MIRRHAGEAEDTKVAKNSVAATNALLSKIMTAKIVAKMQLTTMTMLL